MAWCSVKFTRKTFCGRMKPDLSHAREVHSMKMELRRWPETWRDKAFSESKFRIIVREPVSEKLVLSGNPLAFGKITG
jgi:hypothetical protein